MTAQEENEDRQFTVLDMSSSIIEKKPNETNNFHKHSTVYEW